MSIDKKNSSCNKILPNPFLLSELIYLSHFASGYPVYLVAIVIKYKVEKKFDHHSLDILSNQSLAPTKM